MRRSPRRLRIASALLVACVACGTPPAAVEPTPTASVTSAPRAPADPVLGEGRLAVRQVVFADESTCALLVDGTVRCWGWLYVRTPAMPGLYTMPLPPVKTILAVHRHVYALTEAGEVFEWGQHADPAWSNRPRKIVAPPVVGIAASPTTLCLWGEGISECRNTDGDVVKLPPGAIAIAAEWRQRCAATAAGLSCEGIDGHIDVPLVGIVDLVASPSRTCARTKDGRVRCFRGDAGRIEVEAFGEGKFASLSANSIAVCARTARGPTTCVLDEDGGASASATPLMEAALREHGAATSVTLSGLGGCFVEGGVLGCWGVTDGDSGTTHPVPVDLGDLASLDHARDITVGDAHACVVGTDDVVRCWGSNTTGALGVGDDRTRIGPERVRSLPPVEKVVARGHLTCAVTRQRAKEEGGRVFCAGGFEPPGGLPMCNAGSTYACTSTPALVTTGATDVTIGRDFACVLDRAGGVRCWGDNEKGQLGAPGVPSSDTPVPVVDANDRPLAGVKKVVAGPRFACALQMFGDAASGDVLCWGQDAPRTPNGERELGPNDKGEPPLRVAATRLRLPGRAIDLAEQCAVLDGGEVHCWGDLSNTVAAGGHAISPLRVGACDARAARGACVLGPKGVSCASQRLPAPRTPRPDPPPLAIPPWVETAPVLAWDVGERVSCVVDAEHRVSCRSTETGEVFFGPGGPSVVPCP